MKSIKLIIAAILACALVLGAGPALAEYTMLMTVTSDGVTNKDAFLPNEYVYVSILAYNEGDPTAIAGAAFSLDYPPDVLAGPEVDSDGVPVGGSVSTTFNFGISTDTIVTDTYRANTVVSTTIGTVYFAGAGIGDDGGAPGQTDSPIELFTAIFKVLDTAPLGPFQLTLRPTKLYNPDAGYGSTSEPGVTEAVTVLVGAIAPDQVGEGEDPFPPLLTTFPDQMYTLKTQSGWVITGTVSYTDTGYQDGDLYVAAYTTSDTEYANPIGEKQYAWAVGQSQQAFSIEVNANGTYNLRAFLDSDDDTVWDSYEATGDYASAIDISDKDDTVTRDFSIVDSKTNGVPDFYTAWAAIYGVDLGGMEDDYDNDDYSNIDEYLNQRAGLVGFNPTSEDAPFQARYDDSLLGVRSTDVSYDADSVLTLTIAVTYNGALTSFAIEETIPDNWTFVGVSGDNAPTTIPAVDATGTLSFGWVAAPASPFEFDYVVQVPADQEGSVTFTGNTIHTRDGSAETFTTPIIETTISDQAYHSADYQEPFYSIDIYEILRVISYYNAGQYYAKDGTPDGYSSSPGTQAGRPHSADYRNGADWTIDIYEVLKVLGYYNNHSYCNSTETLDGYTTNCD